MYGFLRLRHDLGDERCYCSGVENWTLVNGALRLALRDDGFFILSYAAGYERLPAGFLSCCRRATSTFLFLGREVPV